LLGDREHIGAAKEAEGVGQVDVPDDEHVGHDGNVRVGHTLRNPDGRGARGVRHDVKNKRLLAVMNLHESDV
jgi:hypothetical protein